MYASLRFPTAPAEEFEYELTEDMLPFLSKCALSEEEQRAAMRFLRRVCPAEEVLAYRGQVGAELLSSPQLQRVFSDLARLGRNFPAGIPQREVDQLRTLARFETFAAEFDEFCKTLQGIIPESDGAKRCLRFLKLYEESFEYKELKHKAMDLIHAFGFDDGVALSVGSPNEEGISRLFRNDPSDGIDASVLRVMKEFDITPPQETVPPPRDYTDTEAAVLTGMIRGKSELGRRMEEFFALYTACGTQDILRLCDEAYCFSVMNKIYTQGCAMGYGVCCPTYLPMGFYTELTDLYYPTEQGDCARADYIASPLNHITLVCGPDSEAYLNSVAMAHVFASAGGLVFAESARISPIDRPERDRKEQINITNLNEHSLCLCAHLFDVMLPRQEEAAVSEVIRQLSERTVRSVVRICSKSNLTALEKQMEKGSLPPCTLLQAGTDRTLEDLLKRHNLTAEELEGNRND